MGVLTGFHELDRKIGGLQDGCLYLVAARPSMGKTGFALNVLDHVSVRDKKTALYFAMETNRRQLVDRVISMESGIDSYRLRNAQLSSKAWRDISAAAETLADSEMIIDDSSGLSIKEIENRCKEYKAENKGLSLIIIDYLQLISGRGESDSRSQELEDSLKELKALAKELATPIIVLSQLSRSVEDRNDHRPLLADLDGDFCSNIAQYVDVVMFIYRDDYYYLETDMKGIAEIIVAKNNDGPIGTVELVWIADISKFCNIPREVEKPWKHNRIEAESCKGGEERIIELTNTEDAFSKLKHLCETRVYEKYDNKNCPYAYREMERELGYIRNNGTALMIMTVYDSLKGVSAGQDQYCLRGSAGSSVIMYLLDFSEIDPLNCFPKLYPEFYAGIDGRKLMPIEMNVTPKLYKRLVRYFEHFEGKARIKHRHFSNGKLFGVYISDPMVHIGSEKEEKLWFTFIKTKSKKLGKKLLKGDAFDVVSPKYFEEQVKCLGFEHGTGNWNENGKMLIETGEIELKDLIAHREDVMEFLLNHGVERKLAYRIAEGVRKGRIRRKGWEPGDLDALHNAGVPAWYIESCEKIQFLFPRAHDMMLLHHYGKRTSKNDII